MGFAFSAYETIASFGTGDLTTDDAIAVAVGDLIVVSLGNASGTLVPTALSDSLGNTYVDAGAYDRDPARQRVFYCLSSAFADASVTFTGTWTGSGNTTRIIDALVFTPDSGDVVTLDFKVQGNAFSTSVATATADTTEADVVAVALSHLSTASPTWSAHQINGVNADSVRSTADDRSAVWYSIFTSTETGVGATATLSSSAHHVEELFVFKSVAGAAGIASRIISRNDVHSKIAA